MSEKKSLTSRKDFIKYISGITIAGSFLGQFWMFLRSIVPNVLYEPLKKISIGIPSRFANGLTFMPKERIFVIKKGNEFHSISAVCTHLGCTVKEHKLEKPEKIKLPDGSENLQEWEFLCPCHGSKFRGNGIVYDGPAPEDLYSWHMSKSPDGSLIVDTGKSVEKNFRIKT